MTSITKSYLVDSKGLDIEVLIKSITEHEGELLAFADKKQHQQKLSSISAPQKRLEYLTSLKLVKSSFGQNAVLSKNEFGAPLVENSKYEISLSHSFPKVVLAKSKHRCGIDVEEIREKVIKIAPKFLTSQELIQTNNDPLKITLFWSAKETVFKLYQKGAVDFKNHIHLKMLDNETIKASFLKGEGFKTHLKYHVFDAYVLVFGHLK